MARREKKLLLFHLALLELVSQKVENNQGNQSND